MDAAPRYGNNNYLAHRVICQVPGCFELDLLTYHTHQEIQEDMGMGHGRDHFLTAVYHF